VIEEHLPVYHFTDDTRLYLSFKPDGQVSQDVQVKALERCIADIQSWMINESLSIKMENNSARVENSISLISPW